MLPKLSALMNRRAQPFEFIDEICDIWQNYERFIFALKFYSSAADNTYRSFHKFAAKYENVLVTEQQVVDKTDLDYKN